VATVQLKREADVIEAPGAAAIEIVAYHIAACLPDLGSVGREGPAVKHQPDRFQASAQAATTVTCKQVKLEAIAMPLLFSIHNAE
jgi:hypothetical protein